MKYGLQLRRPVITSHQKKKAAIPRVFCDEEDDVERDISRQAAKRASVKDVEEQHRRALKEDPSAFDYDGVYEEMKEKEVRVRVEERRERKPRYIQGLMVKAKEREREHDIIYERKLARERSKEDELYADKDKFVTGAYKRKLMDQANWLQEDRIRHLRDCRDDVTTKTDLTDFYFNLSKNVAFGGGTATSSSTTAAAAAATTTATSSSTTAAAAAATTAISSPNQSSAPDVCANLEAPNVHDDSDDDGDDDCAERADEHRHIETTVVTSDLTNPHRQDRSTDDVSAARERFLARKRAKMNAW